MSGFNPREHGQWPATLMLGEAIRLRQKELFALATEQLAEQGLVPSSPNSGYSMLRDDVPRFPFVVDEVDEVSIGDILADENFAALGLNLYSDDQQYLFATDRDSKINPRSIDYDLVVLGEEVPPFIAHTDKVGVGAGDAKQFLKQVGEGKQTPPVYLDEVACQQILAVIMDPVFNDLIKLEEIATEPLSEQ